MRKFLIGLAIGLVAAGSAALLGTLSFFKTVELKTYDQRLRWTADPESVCREIVIVEIDEDSVRRLDPLVGRWPWPRVVHAEVIDYLARAPAKVIAYDVSRRTVRPQAAVRRAGPCEPCDWAQLLRR